MNSWEEARKEIVDRLENPTREEIAKYIESAYKMGYKKGLNVSLDIFIEKIKDIEFHMRSAAKSFGQEGKWEGKEPHSVYDFYTASECGRESELRTKYCSHCGAKMETEE